MKKIIIILCSLILFNGCHFALLETDKLVRLIVKLTATAYKEGYEESCKKHKIKCSKEELDAVYLKTYQQLEQVAKEAGSGDF